MSRGALVIAVFALAFGAAVGFVAGRSAGEAPTGLPQADRPDPGPREGAGDPATPPPLPPGIALPDIDVPSLPTGKGVIRGQITTKEGTPVADVVVRAELQVPYPPTQERTGLPEERELAEIAREAVLREAEKRANRRETVSGKDGTYEISGLPVRGFLVRAYRSGFRVHPREGRSFLVTPDAEFDFTAIAVAEVEIDVLLPDGSRPEGARMQAVRGTMKPGFYWQAGRTRMLLEPGTWTFHATAGPHWQYSKTVVDVDVGAGDGGTPLTIRLDPKPGVHGRILDHDIHYVHYEVKSLPLDPGTAPAPEVLLTDGLRANVSRDGDAWSYFVSVKDRPVLVGLVLEGNRVADHEVIQPTGRLVERDFRIPPPDPGSTFILRIVGPGGGLLEGHASAAYQHPTKWVAGSLGTRLPDGTVRVPHPPEGPDHPGPGGRYLVIVTTKYHGRRQVEYAGPSASEVTVEFPDPATLEIRLGNHETLDVMRDVRVKLYRLEGKERTAEAASGSRNFDTSGRFALHPLVPGRFDLVLEVQSARGRWLPAVSRSLTVTSGQHVEEIPLPALHDLSVLVEGDVRQLVLRPSDPEKRSFGIRGPRRGSRVEFEKLPPGDYELADQKGRKMTVTIPTGGEVRFVPD